MSDLSTCRSLRQSPAYSTRGGRFVLPERLMPGLRRWVDDGILPGGFLLSVLTNDLRGACERGDPDSLANLHALVAWLCNEAPPACHGSLERVHEWHQRFTGGTQ